MAASSCSSTQGAGGRQTAGDLVVFSLEDLRGYDFKKLKNKLSDLSHGDKRPIPRGPLEDADWVTTKDLLIDAYGEEGALEVLGEALQLIGLQGPASDLQKRRAHIANQKKSSAESRLTGFRTRYLEWVRGDFQQAREYNSRLGEAVSLQERYHPLLLIKGHRHREEREHEIAYVGKRHEDMMKERAEHSATTIPALFDPDRDGITPKVVVLQGPAGIGKTWTSWKIMLDWASGKLFQDQFDFVFYLSCRELNTITGRISLVGLLSRTCGLPCSRDLHSILRDSPKHDRLLLVIDGFDELAWTLNEDRACADFSEETHKEVLLQSLLRKQILYKASLVITTRPLAQEKLDGLNCRYVEILGFTGDQCQAYVCHFFEDRDDAEKALGVIKDNEVLLTMCTVPIVCWIVCTVLRQEIKKDLDFIQYKTATSIYLLYLEGLMRYHGRKQPAQACLRKLCALAYSGVYSQKILFDKKDLESSGVSISEVESLFLNKNIFYMDIKTQTCYSFIHLSMQELLAALHLVLEEGSGEGGQGPLTRVNTFIKHQFLVSHHRERFQLTLNFLYGFLNEKQLRAFSENTGCAVSLPAVSAIRKWLIRDGRSHFDTESILGLYEAQDSDLMRRVLSSRFVLDTNRKLRSCMNRDFFRKLRYCFSRAEELPALSFRSIHMDPEDLEMLFPFLERCRQLCLHDCHLTLPCLDVLRPLTRNQTLVTLEMSITASAQQEVRRLCELLGEPGCSLQELSLYRCHMSPSCYEDLHSLLTTNQSLIKLKLSCKDQQKYETTYIDPYYSQPNIMCVTNRPANMEDSGVQRLGDGLRAPGCTLQELSFQQCYVTSQYCDELRSVLAKSLTKLDLTYNHNLKDQGVKILCEGLEDPGCTLQELSLRACGLSPLCCDDLCSVLITSRSLTKLDVSWNRLMNPGVARLCEGLRSPGCTLRGLIFHDCSITSYIYDVIAAVINTNRTLVSLEGSVIMSGKEHYRKAFERLGCTLKGGAITEVTYRRPSTP